MEQFAPVFLLNDDCLLEIFRLLDLESQVRFALVSPRFCVAFQLHCQRRCRILRKDDLNNLTRREIKFFFEIAGVYVREIFNLPYKDHERNDWVTWVHEHCTRVLKLNFSHTRIKSKCFCKILANMQQLVSVQLQNCSLDNNAMLGVSRLSRLENLRIENEPNVTGTHLSKLENLKEVIFVQCNIENKHLIEMFKSSRQIKKLKIAWCQFITDDAISSMPEFCPELETLILEGLRSGSELSQIAHLPKLTKLEVIEDYNYDFVGELLISLATYKGEQLECLCIGSRKSRICDYADKIGQLKKLKLLNLDRNKYIDSATIYYISQLKDLVTISLRYCPSIVSQDVLKILRGCKRLKYVNIMYCQAISEDLVPAVIQLVQKQWRSGERRQWDVPVLMLVAGTEIDESILDSEQYVDDKRFLRLSSVSPYRYAYFHKYTTSMPTFGDLRHFYETF